MKKGDIVHKLRDDGWFCTLYIAHTWHHREYKELVTTIIIGHSDPKVIGEKQENTLVSSMSEYKVIGYMEL